MLNLSSENLVAQRVPASVPLLGTHVTRFDTVDDAVDLIHMRVVSRQRTFCIAINPEKIYRAKQDARLQQVLDSADIRICDGIGTSIAARLLHGVSLPRCTGVDLFMRLIALSEQEGWRVFLLGASPESNEAARRLLGANFPCLRIAGSCHGYFDDVSTVVKNINDSGVDLLFVGMGSPRQEFWISEHMPQLRTSLCMGIGGSLDVLSGSARRAPGFLRSVGAEWLYRLLLQPVRFRRQMALPLFAREVLREAIGRRAPTKTKVLLRLRPLSGRKRS